MHGICAFTNESSCNVPAQTDLLGASFSKEDASSIGMRHDQGFQVAENHCRCGITQRTKSAEAAQAGSRSCWGRGLAASQPEGLEQLAGDPPRIFHPGGGGEHLCQLRLQQQHPAEAGSGRGPPGRRGPSHQQSVHLAEVGVFGMPCPSTPALNYTPVHSHPPLQSLLHR